MKEFFLRLLDLICIMFLLFVIYSVVRGCVFKDDEAAAYNRLGAVVKSEYDTNPKFKAAFGLDS